MMNDVIKLLEEAMELDTGALSITSELKSLDEWDSLAIVTFMALADARLSIQVPADEIISCSTVENVADLVQSLLAA